MMQINVQYHQHFAVLVEMSREDWGDKHRKLAKSAHRL